MFRFRLWGIRNILRDDVEYQERGPAYLDTLDKARISSRLVQRLEGLGYEVELRPPARLRSQHPVSC